MSYGFNPFESETKRLRKIAGSMKCPVHRKSVRVTFDYDHDGNVSAVYLHQYCCEEFAKTVGEAIWEDCGVVIYLKDENGRETVIIEAY